MKLKFENQPFGFSSYKQGSPVQLRGEKSKSKLSILIKIVTFVQNDSKVKGHQIYYKLCSV